MSSCSRIHDRRTAEQIGEALRLIGPRIRERLGHVQFVVGVDPVFAGVHSYEDTADGRSYRQTACCLYPHHIIGPRDRRVVTVCLPVHERKWTGVWTVIHELGHALDYTIGRDHIAEPVNEYAETNREEAFAEAFASWVWGQQIDPATRALFRMLDAA